MFTDGTNKAISHYVYQHMALNLYRVERNYPDIFFFSRILLVLASRSIAKTVAGIGL